MEPLSRRGSDKLRAQLGSRRFGPEQLERLAEVLERQDLSVLDLFPIGIPEPEFVRSTLKVRPEQLGGVAQSFFELPDLRVSKLDVFPLGVPVIDELLIDIEVAPGFR